MISIALITVSLISHYERWKVWRPLRRLVASLGGWDQLGTCRFVRLESRRSDLWLMGVARPSHLHPRRSLRSAHASQQEVRKVSIIRKTKSPV